MASTSTCTRWVRTLVASLLLLAQLTGLAHAQPPSLPSRVEAIPPGEDRIVTLSIGEKAPFTGQLYGPETALRWANFLAQYKLRLEKTEAYSVERLALEQEYFTKKFELYDQAHTTQRNWYRDRLAEAESERDTLRRDSQNPPFYKTVWFGFVAGVVTLGLAIGLGGAIIATAK